MKWEVLIGKFFSEAQLLQVAPAYQLETDWLKAQSPLSHKGGL
ncbi:MAG: hypothetical protein ACKOD7_06705 [Polynucleobacter victoriensis]